MIRVPTANWYVAAQFKQFQHSLFAPDWDGLQSVSGSSHSKGQMMSSKQGRTCPGLDHVKHLMINPAGCPEFTSQMERLVSRL